MDIVEEISEYERRRAENKRELEAMMSDFDNADVSSGIAAINSFQQQRIRTERKKRKRHDEDETFRFTGSIPLQMRKSARLSNIVPEYTYLDLPDDDFKKQVDYDDIDSLESIVFKKRRSSTTKRFSVLCEIVPVEDITPQYLANIAKRNTVKVYSQNGTSCHQCRQKTTDSKTYCRSGRCIGVRGQFCGVCLQNRYGEEAGRALMNPRWECPPCRGLCNCSICRTRQGKRPTGILAPVAFRHGHKSVKDFLISLNGIGDFYEESEEVNKEDVERKSCIKDVDCEHVRLLGFDKYLYAAFTLSYVNGLCDGEYDLIGFNSQMEPVLVDYVF